MLLVFRELMTQDERFVSFRLKEGTKKERYEWREGVRCLALPCLALHD